VVGTANPDPCVSARSLLPNGNVRITVLSSTASEWSFAAGIRVHFQARLNPRIGYVGLRGNLDTMPPGDVLSVSTGLFVRVQGPNGPHIGHAWTAAECQGSGAGKLRCDSADGGARARFLPRSATRFQFSIRVRTSITPMLVPGAMTVSIRYGTSSDHAGVTA